MEYCGIVNTHIYFTGRSRNFLKYSREIINSREIPYDYGSIMHYSRLHFTKNAKKNKETIVPKDKNAYIGQRVALSPLDIKQANLLYNCGSSPYGDTGQGQNSMMPDGGMDTDATY